MRTSFRMEDEYITIIRGDTLAFGLEVKDDEGNGVDLDKVVFSCKSNKSDSAYLFVKSLGNGITNVGGGHYTVRVAPDDTVNAEPGKYFYDLEIQKNGDVFTPMHGIFEIEQDVSR